MLIDLHMHSTFSDGQLNISELVDLYGKQGFGAISITDHLCEEKTFLGKAANYLDKTLLRESFQNYLDLIAQEAERAWRMYKMVLIPGVEITKNSLFNHRSAHVLILGIQKYISADMTIDGILSEAKNQGALTVAAHPVFTREVEKQTYHLWDRKEDLKNKIDLWEVASGQHIFPEVLESKLKMVASSDLHRPSQISSWKTKVNCERRQDALFENLIKQNVDFDYFEVCPKISFAAASPDKNAPSRVGPPKLSPAR